MGGIIPDYKGSLDSMDPSLTFWLQTLCYEPLMVFHRSGEIEGRLATDCEPVDGFSRWHLRLRKDLRWSDGKPIDIQEVIQAFDASRLAPIITEMKPDGKTQLRIRLSRPEPLFAAYLRSIFVFPSHSPEPYHVFSGAYCVKRFRRNAITFRFKPNPNCHRDTDYHIDWLTLTRFIHPANAMKAIESGKLDLLFLRVLHSLYQYPVAVPQQQWPFSGDSYYALFLNRRKGVLSDERSCRTLQEAMDYRAIDFFLHMGQMVDGEELHPSLDRPLDLRVTCDGQETRYLAYLVGKSVKSSVTNPISTGGNIGKGADAHLTQIFLGIGYSRLWRYFRSDGETNPCGYANPQVDEMLHALDQTADMAKREAIGEQVLSLLQDDFAVILLAPCLEYSLSPLEVEFGDRLNAPIDLSQNMSNLVVERNRH